jgi:LDH2 family malate/lactate/ureidoglycolate dehydrogenase
MRTDICDRALTRNATIPVVEEALVLDSLTNEEAERSEHADAAVRELGLAVALDLLGGGVSCKAEGVEVAGRLGDAVERLGVCAACTAVKADRSLGRSLRPRRQRTVESTRVAPAGPTTRRADLPSGVTQSTRDLSNTHWTRRAMA